MAVTDAGRRLTEAHRLAQANLSARTLRELLTVWRLLDPTRLDATFPAYAGIARALITTRREESAGLAAAYLRAFRQAEGVTAAPLDVALAQTLAQEQAMTSLLVTGPVAVKVATRNGATLERAAQIALTQTAGAVLRHVQNGGRETVHATVMRDEEAHGIARVTDGRPCAFCAMLASRGPVFKSEMTADFKAHDRCGCGAEPVYSRTGYSWPGGARQWRDLWTESTAGLSGDQARAAFRRAYAA